MDAHTLFTYRNIEELRRIQEKQVVVPFAFVDTKQQIETSPKITIDISSLVYLLQIDKSNLLSVYVNFKGMTKETVIIAEEAVSKSALEILPYLLFNTTSFFPDEDGRPEQSEPVVINPRQRRKIYKYNNTAELDQIVQYSTEHGIPIATFASANGGLRQEFEQFNKAEALAIMDLTSVSYALEDNKALIYFSTNFLPIILHENPSIFPASPFLFISLFSSPSSHLTSSATRNYEIQRDPLQLLWCSHFLLPTVKLGIGK